MAYCVPGTAMVSVKCNGRTVASADVTLSQLGVVFGLNPALFTDKKHLVPPAGWEKAEGPGHFRLYK